MSVDDSRKDAWEAMRVQRGRITERKAPLFGGGGGGTSDGMSDDWKASVDGQLKTLHEDFRKLFGWLIAAIGVPLLAVIGLYVYSGMKADTTNARIDMLSNQVAAVRVDQERQRGDLREANAQINGKLDRIADRLPK